jgi:hypothetical protein
MAFDTPYHNKKRRFENGSTKGIKYASLIRNKNIGENMNRRRKEMINRYIISCCDRHKKRSLL